MKIQVLDSAWADLSDGFDFYEDAEPGVGDYFFDSLFADIDSLRTLGGIHAMKFGFHRLVATKFPFAIYYGIAGDTIIVRRVLDSRRDPKWIRKQFK